MKTIENQEFDEERALYGSRGLRLRGCAFDGPADGESALKESTDITFEHGLCNLRYPFWHDHGLTIRDTVMTPLCRAALWYSDQIEITGTELHGIKALRECRGVVLEDCDIVSPEFGWSVRDLHMRRCTAESEYGLLRAEDLNLSDVRFKGKYAFQYTRNAVIVHCRLETKDAFWHAENVTVTDSILQGEYLAWYSDGLTLVNCTILGTQPFCYCKNLKLIDCELVDADLAFEKSDVDATITAPVISVKNPRSGRIVVPAVGDIIRDDDHAKGEIVVTKQEGGIGDRTTCVCA